MTSLTPKASNLPKENIEIIAEDLHAALKYDPEMSLPDFVRGIGGELDVIDVWEDNEEHGALIAFPDGSFTINLAAHTSERRDRFTMAHELGHLFIHYLREKDLHAPHASFRATRYGSNRVEWEANWFASAFLMPKDQFNDVFSKYAGNIFQVADHFKVSEQAATIRAENLGLAD
jgi:predicted transcriptional regulator